jgi:uncharacterized protein YdcH (DUF465 family)
MNKLRMAIGLLFVSALLSASLSAQAAVFSQLREDLDELDQVIASQEESTTKQSKHLETLRELMLTSERESSLLKNLSETQGTYVKALLLKTEMLEAIHQEQQRYQRGLKKELLGWKIGTITLGLCLPAAVITTVVLLTK